MQLHNKREGTMLLQVLMMLLPAACMAARDGWVEVCSSDLGHMDIYPDTQFVMPIRESDRVHTIFVHSSPTYNFECSSSNEQVPVAISIKEKPANTSDVQYKSVVVTNLNSAEMKNENAVNKNESVICYSAEQILCRVNLVVIDQENPDCQFSDALSCNISSWISQINAVKKSNDVIGTRDGNLPSAPFISEAPSFNPIVKYSFFDQSVGSWVYCQEVDGKGTVIGLSSHLENSTQTIVCPIKLTANPRPIIIRIEQTKQTSVSVGLPIFNNVKATFTYFSVFVNSTLSVEEVDSNRSGETVTIIAICLAMLLAGLLVVAAAFFIRRKLCAVHKGGSKFYADIKLVDSVGSKEKDHHLHCGGDDYSMTTETTTAYNRLHGREDFDASSLFELFGPEELEQLRGNKEPPFQYMDKRQLRTLLMRQLSGDITKLNPELSLNQQANMLPYNPKLEIDRSNFSVGQLLGSGNFGSVYVGQAVGLLHPGSETKVAIKTVHDLLDVNQFSALLCEMKILTNLDLHLNLVNLLGSCTSEMEQARLWLLLEFCPNGDLKSFLIRNREQLKNNIRGLVATELEVRTFLKWAHSVAKGMEYLSSRKIMHGDLAARNVMLGENLVAKVGDFGLSKSMYSNPRYKKQERNYVPWKWMALEYLTDACFTLKSDVWSYGVVLWEMFSLGQEPYMAQQVDEVVEQIKQGHRLSLPEEMEEVDWARVVYEKVMQPSWTANPDSRCSFPDIVEQIELLLEAEEMLEYNELSQQNVSMRKLMFDDQTVSKRNTLSARSSLLPPGSYHKVFSMTKVIRDDDDPADAAAANYISVQEASAAQRSSDEYECLESNESSDTTVSSSCNYLSLSDARQLEVQQQQRREEVCGGGGGYVSLDAAKQLETEQQQRRRTSVGFAPGCPTS